MVLFQMGASFTKLNTVVWQSQKLQNYISIVALVTAVKNKLSSIFDHIFQSVLHMIRL